MIPPSRPTLRPRPRCEPATAGAPAIAYSKTASTHSATTSFAENSEPARVRRVDPRFAQEPEQEARVHARADARRQRQPRVAEAATSG